MYVRKNKGRRGRAETGMRITDQHSLAATYRRSLLDGEGPGWVGGCTPLDSERTISGKAAPWVAGPVMPLPAKSGFRLPFHFGGPTTRRCLIGAISPSMSPSLSSGVSFLLSYLLSYLSHADSADVPFSDVLCAVAGFDT